MKRITKKRSLAKAVTWRVLASIITFISVLIVGGSLNFALSVGIIEVSAKMLFYYSHERVWNNVEWGRE